MKVLYLVHGHEQFSIGGAENAAFSLFREAQDHPEVEAWILSAVHTSKGVLAHGELRSVEGTDREYLIGTSCEWFRFTNTHISSLKRGLHRLLQHVRPEIIHLQHYVHFGIDVIPLLQSLCPEAKIVVTLHEYLALCMHNGQMVTTGQLKLCNQATPLACSMCYPEHNTSDFFLRHHYIKTILESCDALISPSVFLIQRYRECGINHSNFVMIENGLPRSFDMSQSQQSSNFDSSALNRFGYFGQLNIYKGTCLLLKAARLLAERSDKKFTLNIYGANLENQSESFQKEFNNSLLEAGNCVSLCGSYHQSDLASLMNDIDWVLVPSVWWENSPVVIQEAFYYRKPVIGSDIGGVAEKVNGSGGLTFSAKNASSLASVMHRAIGNTSLYQSLQSQIRKPSSSSDCLSAHMRLYNSCSPQ